MASIHTVFRSPTVRVLGIGLVVSLAVISCRQLGLLEALELSAYDGTVRLAPQATVSDSRIVLITITEEDLEYLGQWPISDAKLADALNTLLDYRPRTIGLDLYRDKDIHPGTEKLHTVFTQNQEIVTVMKFPDQHGKGVPGPPILQGTDQIGFNDILVDPGGIVRRGFLFLGNQDGTAISFSLLLALKYLEKEGIVPLPDITHPELMRIGETTIPRFRANDGSYVKSDASGYQLLVKYSGKDARFRRFTLTELLSGTMKQDEIEDKIVIIGSAAKSVRDDFYTPYSFGRDRQQQMPGMELHAHLVSQFVRMAYMQEKPIRSLSEGLEAAWIILWGSVGALCALGLFSPWRFLLIFGGGLASLVVFVYWSFLASWWIPLISPAMAWVSAGGVATTWISKRSREERAMLMRLFSQHVSSEVANRIWADREQWLQGGRIRPQKLTATVLFVDLEGFTAVAEQLEPEALMEWLNTYLMSIANVIAAHDGVVDDFFGDGVKANFGVPVSHTEESDIRQDAINAVQCGLALFEEVQRLNEMYQHRDVSIGSARIGIATGSVVAGSVGSDQRLKYTTVGDVVNLAARLEQLGKDPTIINKNMGFGSLLVSQETHSYILDACWEIHQVGHVSLPGKQGPILVYRVVSGPPGRCVLNS